MNKNRMDPARDIRPEATSSLIRNRMDPGILYFDPSIAHNWISSIGYSMKESTDPNEMGRKILL